MRNTLADRSRWSGAGWILYILPAFAMYVSFMAFPVVNSMRLSFYTGSGFTLNNFIGFDNYVKLFNGSDISLRFLNAFKNNWIFFAIHMLVQNSLGLVFAVLLSGRLFRGRSAFRVIIFIPATLSTLVTGYLWKLILNPQWGAINNILNGIGLESWALPWLGDPRTALITVSLVSSWQCVGLPTMMFLAGLERISGELFEAAEMDGANPWQVFSSVKLPLILPIVGIVSILTFVGNFSAFDGIYALEGPDGPPLYSTDIMGTFFYRVGIAGQHPAGIPNLGIGAATATLTFVVLFAGVLLARRLTQARDESLTGGRSARP
jgi:raffinose/stachyose/melibiose transport system permease protein